MVEQDDTEPSPEVAAVIEQFGLTDTHAMTDLYDRGIHWNGATELEVILAHWKNIDFGSIDWRVLKGSDVLDLACGVDKTTGSKPHQISPIIYEPWFARICAVNGANVTGVDILPQGQNDAKLFQGIQADLLPVIINDHLSNLPGLNGRKFDIIHASAFVGKSISYDVEEELTRLGVSARQFTSRLISQSALMLKQDGMLSFGEVEGIVLVIYQLKDSQLVKILINSDV